MKGQSETRGWLKCRESNLSKLLEDINAGLDILSILLQLHVQCFRIFLEVHLSCQDIPQYPLDLLTYSKLSMRTGEHCVLVWKIHKMEDEKASRKVFNANQVKCCQLSKCSCHNLPLFLIKLFLTLCLYKCIISSARVSKSWVQDCEETKMR
jgi:hypothetical protein